MLNETEVTELLRLVREIHAVWVTAPATVAMPRTLLKESVMDVMSDGQMRAPYQIWQVLQERGILYPETSVLSMSAFLAKGGKLAKIRKNLYQLAKDPV